jgi:hypothetical protein
MHRKALTFFALGLAPLAAQASDTRGFAEAGFLLVAYAGALSILIAICLVAIFRTRSLRPLLILPISVVFAAALMFLSVSAVPSGPFAFPLLVLAPVLAVPLALAVYRDLSHKHGTAGSSRGA